MKINKRKIGNNIYLLMFENQFELCSTMLRFQEYYESPKFKNKIFTLEEYKKWYSKGNKKFTYYYFLIRKPRTNVNLSKHHNSA